MRQVHQGEPIMKKQATQEISILHIYRWKEVSRICFEIESTDGSQKYNVCFSEDTAHGSCTCDGHSVWHKVCKHITGLTGKAAEYFEARKPAAPVSSSVAILTPEGVSVIDKSELTANDILADEQDECPGMIEAEKHIADLKARELAQWPPAPQKEAWTDAEERRYNAPLNGNNRGFSLMR
jgi:hypothetical protein